MYYNGAQSKKQKKAKGDKNMLKKKIAKTTAKAAEKMARIACGSASHFGMHQFKEPSKLSKVSK